MRAVKTDQAGQMPRQILVFTGHTCHFVGFVLLRLICLKTVGGISNADMQISYQVREDSYKYLVNASSIRFSFKCLRATCSVQRHIKNQMGNRIAPCII